ncbi:hypothetical protein KY328_02815 [Candidatus Woesearchaeota archaeon]|nr:hypothetical protein [Candidatus Woesearchaeota archaeon]MBW3021825.1 hypothetical protein [Candidatus Woesearchaeota archaeon]
MKKAIILILITIISIFVVGCRCAELEFEGNDVCAFFEMFGFDYDHCCQKAAVSTGNYEDCNDISKSGPRSKCYILVNRKNPKPENCNALEIRNKVFKSSDDYDAEICWAELAALKKDKSYCEKLAPSFETFPPGLDLTQPINKENCIKNAGG